MNDRITRLATPEGCERFIKNALNLGRGDLAVLARQRALELRADLHGCKSDTDRDCLLAVFAFEETLPRKDPRRKRSSRTWQLIKQHGFPAALEDSLKTNSATPDYYHALCTLGLQQFSFEAVVSRHPELFSTTAIDCARERNAAREQVASVK